MSAVGARYRQSSIAIAIGVRVFRLYNLYIYMYRCIHDLNKCVALLCLGTGGSWEFREKATAGPITRQHFFYRMEARF